MFAIVGCARSHNPATNKSAASVSTSVPQRGGLAYQRRNSRYEIKLTSKQTTALVVRLRNRLRAVTLEAATNNQPTVPPRCFPDIGFRLQVTYDGIEQLASADQDGYALPPENSGFAIAEAFGRRTPTGELLNIVVVRVADPHAATATLSVGKRTADRAPVNHGWAVLIYATPGLSFLSDVDIPGAVIVADAAGSVLGRTPVPAPEHPGHYC